VQRSLLAGAAVVVAAVVFGAIFWTSGEDKAPAEQVAVPESTESEAQQGESAQTGVVQAEAGQVGTTDGASAPEVVRATEEGAQPVGGETGAAVQSGQTASQAAESDGADTQVAALPPGSTPLFIAPSFDIVRVEPNGEAVIAGRSEPGSLILLFDGDEEIGRVTADESGAWVIILAHPLTPGDHQLGLRAEMPDGSVQLSDTLVIVSVPDRTLEVASGELADQELAAGPGDELGALAVEIPREGLGASRVLQQPEDAGLRDQALLLNAVDYNADGYVVISGRAEPGARIVVYLDEEPLGTVMANGEGYWELAPDSPVASGLHRLRVDHVDDSGDVLARVATLFSRAELASGFPENRYVIVQPGNSLWRIARRTYGEGVRYSVIFQANNNQIADPDLIFPGQIFLVPGVN